MYKVSIKTLEDSKKIIQDLIQAVGKTHIDEVNEKKVISLINKANNHIEHLEAEYFV